MLVWSACANVSNSGFVDHQQSAEDFAKFVEVHLDDDTFIEAEHKHDLPLFMPAEYARVGARRIAANVLRIHFLVVDFDKGSDEELHAVLEQIQKHGHFIYTSFNHDPNGQAKFRACVKLSRPVDITEWAAFFPRALGKLGAEKLADMRCADACHMYFTPGGNKAKFIQVGSDGPALDVDAVLAMPLPKGLEEAQQLNYAEVLDENDRGEVDAWLKMTWDAKLSNLEDEIARAPYPGPVYHLTSHAVFGIARGIGSNITTESRVRGVLRSALERRYRRHADDPAAEGYHAKSIKQIDKAIVQGIAKPWWPPKVDELTAHSLDEIGLRERLLEKFHVDLAYEPAWLNWLVWNKQHWTLEAGNALVQEKMIETVDAILDERDAHYADHWRAKEFLEGVKDDPNTPDEVKSKAEHEFKFIEKRIENIEKFAEKSRTRAKISSGVGLASSDQRVLANHNEFNTNPWLLNFQNGTLDLRTGELHEHQREDMITRIVPHTFSKNMPTPHFDRFLSECMQGDQRMVNFLWRLMGYTIVGVTTEQILVILHGDGANGKSTFLRVFLEMLGHGPNGYGFAAQSSNLLTSKGADQHSTWRMSLFGKRLVVCQEVEEGRTFAESQIKELTGDDLITGRKMRQDEWSFPPEFTPWLGCNSLPHIRGVDEGVWRRMLVIEWRASFRGREDRTMLKKLIAEIPGIWARVAREAVLWRERGLEVPEDVTNATSQYRKDQDPLREFFEKWCVTGEAETFVSSANLWNAYDEYCQETRQRTFHERKRFHAAVEKTATVLQNLFRPHKTNGIRGFGGVRLKSAKERIDGSAHTQLLKALEEQEQERKLRLVKK